MGNVIIYARQSSGDEDFSDSIEMQIEQCKAAAAAAGHIINGVYYDRNLSGKTYPNNKAAISLSKNDVAYQNWLGVNNDSSRKKYREGLGKVIDSLEKIDFLYVFDYTRLMRPITDSFLESYIKQIFILNNVKVYSLKEGVIDFTIFSSGLITSLESRVNDNQIKIARDKSLLELRKKRDDGYRFTGADFMGFKYAGKQKVMPVEEELAIVKYVFENVIKGKSYTVICREINKLFPRPTHIFRYNDIMKIVKRYEYAGYCVNSKGEIIESKVFPCIVPLSTILEAQKITNKKRFSNRDKEKIHPLSGLVKCGLCGRNMIIVKSTPMAGSHEDGPVYYYKCMHNIYDENKDKCINAPIREDYVNDFNGLLEACLPLLVIQLCKELTPHNDNEKTRAEITIKLNKIDSLEKILDKRLVNGELTESEYNERFDEYVKEKRILKASLLELDTKNTEEIEKSVKRMIEHRFIPYNIYKKLAAQTFEKILIFPEYIEVYLVNYSRPIVIERITARNARVLPKYKIERINEKIVITYFYKSYYKEGPEKAEKNVIFEDSGIKIISLGNNLSKRSRRKK